jgi:hypothetical protein
VVARDTYRLVNHFKGQSGIETMDEYGLLCPSGKRAELQIYLKNGRGWPSAPRINQ